MKEFELVIGLEIHAELSTESKLFCSCRSQFGAPPNHNICPICMGHPGTLPSLNRRAVELALRAGLALNCTISELSLFDRKHYAYPDLPKAYQITQFYNPLCKNGYLTVNRKRIGITQIHIEEDAGKLLHEGQKIKIDYNRCGVPLIEIVTEPSINSAEEASDFCQALRELLLFAGVCDGKMNEGSLRCDVNLSLHCPGEPLGERTEIKNLNSFKFIRKAICAEEERQLQILKSGGKIKRQTLRFDEKTEKTIPMRRKEDSADYRYFPEPDLPALRLRPEEISSARATMPPLPEELRNFLTSEYGLDAKTLDQLMVSPERIRGFLKTVENVSFPALCGRLYAECVKDLRVNPRSFAALCDLAGREEIALSDAKRLASELSVRDFDPRAEAKSQGILLVCDPDCIKAPLEKLLAEHPEKVLAYRQGKTALLGFFIGVLKNNLAFPVSPKLLAETVKKQLEKSMEETTHE